MVAESRWAAPLCTIHRPIGTDTTPATAAVTIAPASAGLPAISQRQAITYQRAPTISSIATGMPRPATGTKVSAVRMP